MPPARRNLTLAALLAALAGCAGPRYQTAYRYEPPADPAGQACVAGCEAALADCRGRCEAEWKTCAARVEPEVEDRYLETLKDYEEDLRRYYLELRRYELDVWLGWGPWWPDGHWRAGGYWHAYPWFPPSHPMPPAAQPTRDSARQALLKERCREDCGCQGEQDRCFTACGGQRIAETRCVANCPDG